MFHCHLFLGCTVDCFFFFFFLSTDWLVTRDFVVCLVLLTCWRVYLDIAVVEMGMNSNVYGYGNGRDIHHVDMYERSCVFRFCATKNLNSTKPWKKKKSACFLWNGTVVGVRVKSRTVVEVRVVNVRKDK